MKLDGIFLSVALTLLLRSSHAVPIQNEATSNSSSSSSNSTLTSFDAQPKDGVSMDANNTYAGDKRFLVGDDIIGLGNVKRSRSFHPGDVPDPNLTTRRRRRSLIRRVGGGDVNLDLKNRRDWHQYCATVNSHDVALSASPGLANCNIFKRRQDDDDDDDHAIYTVPTSGGWGTL